jgi:hypothetical protein
MHSPGLLQYFNILQGNISGESEAWFPGQRIHDSNGGFRLLGASNPPSTNHTIFIMKICDSSFTFNCEASSALP